MRFKTAFLIRLLSSVKSIEKVELSEDVLLHSSKRLYAKKSVLDIRALQKVHHAKISSLSIILHPSLLRILHSLNPSRFRLANEMCSAKALVSKIHLLNMANKQSIIQRSLVSCTEILDIPNRPLLQYGQILKKKDLEAVIQTKGESEKIAYAYSDYKIALYVNLLPRGKDFRSRFLRNTEIIQTLIKRHNTVKALHHLNKLHVEEDFFMADEPEMLINLYKENNIRLIMVGPGTEGKFRDMLIHIKRIDPFARFMLTSPLDPKQYKKFLLEVELNYSRDNLKNLMRKKILKKS